ncbi:MAG: helix-turn-helix domain-containing protein [Oscillospiraceae bacterium]|nr:helix-turn-helix domain-containing protein [Oscillospiraceae bacterium]
MEKQETLGQRLRRLMEEGQLNYEALGRLLEMRPQTLNRYVLGQREPKAGVAAEMAQKLGVDLLWLQGYDVPRQSRKPACLPGESMIPVLGVIKAGIPAIALQQIEGYAPADVARPEEYFYLRVSGDSMKNAGIRTGDLVLIHQQPQAENGQIVACIVEEEDATLKRFHRQRDWVVLQPENPDYQPYFLPASDFETGRARIVGVAVRLVRDL